MTKTSKTGSAIIKRALEANNIRWRNRRRMAWVSLISLIVYTAALLLFVDIEKIKALEETSTWFYISTVTVISAYIGATTAVNIMGTRDAVIRRKEEMEEDDVQSTPEPQKPKESQ